MALEKNDLKQIREIVREETHDQINAEVPSIVEGKIFPLREEIKALRKKIEQVWKSESEDVVATVKDVEKHQKEIDKIKIRIKSLEGSNATN